MPRSAVAKGAYWKSRTKRWLEAQGFAVAFLERVLWIQGKRGLIPVKRDQLASDVLAVSQDRVLFVQVKGGESRPDWSAARKEFALYPLPPSAEQWTVYWEPNARAPEIEVVAVGPCGPRHAVRVPARKKPRVLPLFAMAR
jgi:hypothetical protein